MKIIKKYKSTIILLFILFCLFVYDKNSGISAANLTLSNIKTMLSFVPPIFILIGLMDVWIPKDIMIKYMGHNSGLKGILLALLLGSIAAGPLYLAFPISALLLKKGARLAYVFFFLGAWSCSKLPLMLFEIASFGFQFTIYHVISSLSVYLIGSLLIEKLLSKETKDLIYTKAESI